MGKSKESSSNKANKKDTKSGILNPKENKSPIPLNSL
jgi:hypothetical protein